MIYGKSLGKDFQSNSPLTGRRKRM